jgi:Deoxyribodipyrimidine photolyase
LPVTADSDSYTNALRDIPVTLYHGNPVNAVKHLSGDVYTIHTATGRYGVERNEKLHQEGVNFVQGDGLRRVENTRDGWSDAIQDYLYGEPYTHDSSAITILDSDVSIEWIEDEYDIEPDKKRVPTGGRQAALKQLHDFADSPEYWGYVSEPTREHGLSKLGPYLRFGCLSIREAFQYLQEHLDGQDKNAITSRLHWNLHYQQKLLDWAGWMDKAVNPALRDMGTFDQEKWDRFKEGETGYPMVDAAVRQLKGTGWCNFRNRAMLASFHSNLLELPWTIGANWMYYHLIDADPAINYTQWQSQTSRVGTNLYRIYNPRKQVRDRDEAADFIREWIPALQELPEKYLDQPEKTPVAIQNKCGVIIGEDYPMPLVEYEAALSRVKRELEQREADAKEALQQDAVRERASLSARSRQYEPDIEALKKTRTTSLDSYTTYSLYLFKTFLYNRCIPIVRDVK